MNEFIYEFIHDIFDGNSYAQPNNGVGLSTLIHNLMNNSSIHSEVYIFLRYRNMVSGVFESDNYHVQLMIKERRMANFLIMN